MSYKNRFLCLEQRNFSITLNTYKIFWMKQILLVTKKYVLKHFIKKKYNSIIYK